MKLRGLSLRRWLAEDQPVRFRTLSQRAAFYFEADNAPAGRIEWIYHRLCSAPDEAATELERLDRDWSDSARPEYKQALAIALGELVATNLIHGRSRVRVLLCIGNWRVERSETGRLEQEARDILKFARELDDARAESDAQCLLGDALQAQGQLGEAEAAFGESLGISRRLAELDPANTSSSWELAMALSRMGGVLQEQGKLAEAQAAYEQFLAISRRLVELDPANPGWQHDLAIAHNQLGGVLQEQGKLAEAQAAFGEDLAISRRLTALDPGNASWQRSLAVTHGWVGGVLQAQGKLAEAQAAFEEYLVTSRKLLEVDPTNLDWQHDLAVAHRKVGGVLQAQGKLDEAQVAFEKDLVISRSLAEFDPGNAAWQSDLAMACWRVAAVHKEAGRYKNSVPIYEEAARNFSGLVERFPDFAASQDMQKDLKEVESELSQARYSSSISPAI
jgi:tetratricopeptide (TPR) repeat protein